jgi:hypothetical protein
LKESKNQVSAESARQREEPKQREFAKNAREEDVAEKEGITVADKEAAIRERKKEAPRHKELRERAKAGEQRLKNSENRRLVKNKKGEIESLSKMAIES